MNIFEIESSLQSIFEELEDNGGELTPELEEKLAITEGDFKAKVKSYCDVIKQVKSDISLIKEEEARLKTLKKTKENLITRLSKIVCHAINEFGDTTKTGTKCVDWGTGKVSVRRTQAVELDEQSLSDITSNLNKIIQDNKETNQLNVIDKIDVEDILRNLNEHITEADLDDVNADVEFSMPIKTFVGEYYPLLATIFLAGKGASVKSNISKSDIKQPLMVGLESNLAHLVTNESLLMK